MLENGMVVGAAATYERHYGFDAESNARANEQEEILRTLAKAACKDRATLIEALEEANSISEGFNALLTLYASGNADDCRKARLYVANAVVTYLRWLHRLDEVSQADRDAIARWLADEVLP